MWDRMQAAFCALPQNAGAVFSSVMDADDVNRILHSDKVSGEEKTSYLLQYLLSQRDVVLDFAKTLLIALVVFLVGRKLLSLFLRLNEKWMDKREVEIGAKRFILSFLKVVYYILLIFIVAGILGVGTSSIVAMVGSAGLAIGLALQGSLSNVAGGVLILLTRPFQVGDYIVVDGVEGTVASIDVFYTKIATVENKIIVIPNGTVSNSCVVNNTKAEFRMNIIGFYIALDTDFDALRQKLSGIMQERELICKDREMSVVIDKITPARMQVLVKFWTKTEDYWTVRYDMLEEIVKSISTE